MAEGKKSFVLYCDLISTVSKLPNDKAGELFKLILEYVNDKNPIIENDLLLEVSFEPIKLQLKRDLKKWDDFRQKQSNNGKLGGRPKANDKPNNPSLLEESQKSLNVTVNVNDTVNVKKKKVFVPPSFLEFESYCKENGYGHIAKKAFTGYDVAGWVDSKGNKVLNWKQKLNNVWFSESNKKTDTSIREGSTMNADGKRIVV